MAQLCPQRGNHFAETSIRSRQTIAELGSRFIRPGATVLTHGYSRVVLALLQRALAQVRHSRQAGRQAGCHAGHCLPRPTCPVRMARQQGTVSIAPIAVSLMAVVGYALAAVIVYFMPVFHTSALLYRCCILCFETTVLCFISWLHGWPICLSHPLVMLLVHCDQCLSVC